MQSFTAHMPLLSTFCSEDSVFYVFYICLHIHLCYIMCYRLVQVVELIRQANGLRLVM